MSEIIKATVTTPEETAEKSERTFTQAEMDAIIGERLSRERAKYAEFETYKAKAEKFDAAEEAAKSDLEKATERANALQAELDTLKKADEVRNIRQKVSEETGVPISLLSGDTEEACQAQAKGILEYAKPSGYPQVKDAGEVRRTSGGATRDQFSDWFNDQLQK